MPDDPEARRLPLERHLASAAARIRQRTNGSCDSEWSPGSNLFLVATTLTTDALLSTNSPVLLGRADDLDCALALAPVIQMMTSLAARLAEDGHNIDLQQAVGQMMGVVLAGVPAERLETIVGLSVNVWQQMQTEEGDGGTLLRAADQAGVAYAIGHPDGVALFVMAVELALATRPPPTASP